MPSDRTAARCRHCGAVVGWVNRPDRPARRGPSARILTAAPGVRVFHDLLMGRVQLSCPACGGCARTIGAESIRGVVVPNAEPGQAA